MERGIGTSRGIGIGHVLIVYNASAVVNRGTHYNAEEEKKRRPCAPNASTCAPCDIQTLFP